MDFKINHLWKIPNVLCYIRILLVPVFLHTYFTAQTQNDYYLAAGIILICSATDLLDGYIARNFNMITDLGRLLDPIADKLMQLSILFALTVTVKYMFLVVAFLVIKELASFILGVTIYRKCNKRLDGAKWYGKVCTAVLDVILLTLIAFPEIGYVWQNILLVVCVGMLAMSWIMYTRLYLIMYRETKAGLSEFKTY